MKFERASFATKVATKVAPRCVRAALRWHLSSAALALVALVATNVPREALAQAPAPALEKTLVVVEFYIEGENFAKIPQRASAIANEIARGLRGRPSPFTVVPAADARKTIFSQMQTSSRRVTDEKLKEIERLMKDGDEMLYTRPREAIEILNRAKRELKEIMETISLNDKIRKDYFRAQMLLASSHFQNGNRTRAAEVLEEVVRVFGDEAKVTEEDYHPDIVALYRESYRKMESLEKASVRVETLPPGAEVLIHGRTQSQKTPATFSGLYPGTLTIQARIGNKESMVHKLTLAPGQQATLAIDIEFETALSFNAKQFGFTFTDSKEMKSKLADFASRIGQILKVDYVFVTGVADVGGDPHLQGYQVNVASKTVERSQSMKTFANVMSKNRVRQMAKFVNDPKFAVQTVYKPWYTNWLGWTGVGVGALGAVLGTVFWVDYKDKKDQALKVCDTCPDYDKRLQLKDEALTSQALSGVFWGVGGIGVVGGALAFLLVKEEDIDASRDKESEEEALLDVPRLQRVSPTVMPDGSPGLGATISF